MSSHKQLFNKSSEIYKKLIDLFSDRPYIKIEYPRSTNISIEIAGTDINYNIRVQWLNNTIAGTITPIQNNKLIYQQNIIYPDVNDAVEYVIHRRMLKTFPRFNCH